MGLSESLKDYTQIIDARLNEYLADARIPERLRESMAYSLFAGGKRLRPCMCMAACEALGADARIVLPLACGLEMIHTYSLIHDDLPCMDDDDMRRGKPSNHRVFGEANAVLAGDGLLSFAFQVMLSGGRECAADAPHYYEAMGAIADGAGVWGMVAGQSDDLAFESDAAAGERELLMIHRNKTGAMLSASVVAGALCTNASREAVDGFRAFGEEFGMLFQITDDILDIEGDASIVGKTLGKDSASDKLTYPRVYGLGRSKELAECCAKRAVEACGRVKGDMGFFIELVGHTLERTM